MAVLATINQAGAVLGDTFENRPVIRVVADGNYVFGSEILPPSNLTREVIAFGTGGSGIGETAVVTSDRVAMLISAATPATSPTLQIPDLTDPAWSLNNESEIQIVNQTGQDVTVDPNGNTAISDSVSVLKDRYVYKLRQTGAAVGGFYYLFEDGRLDSATETYQGLQIVDEFDQGFVGVPDGAVISTGINFDLCDSIEFEMRDVNGDFLSVGRCPADLPIGDINAGLVDWNASRYLRPYFADAAAKTAGDITVADLNGALYIGKIRGLAYATNGFVIPTATTLAAERTISLTGGLGTINGGATGVAYEGVPVTLKLDLNAGQQIATVAIDVGTIEPIDPVAGTVLVTAGNADATITITETLVATKQGLQVVGEIDQGWVDHPNGSTIATGINFDICDIIELELGDSNGQHRSTIYTSADIVPGVNNGGLAHWYDTVYMRLHFADAAAKTNGDLKLNEINSATITVGKIRGLAYAENGFVIPTATVSKIQVSVTATGDSTTVNGGGALGNYLEGAGTQSILIDLPVGQGIDKSATEVAINAIAGVTAVVTNPIIGKVEFTIDEGTGNVAFPITHIPTVDGVQVFTFQQTNAALGPVTPIEGWQFDMRSDTRQMRIINSSTNKRIIHSTGAYRESTAGGDALGGTNIGTKNIGVDVGEAHGLTNNDLNFDTGGGAATGDVEYAIVEVWELDPVDRLKFVKLHTLYVSAAVGNGWVDNSWRVEVHP